MAIGALAMTLLLVTPARAENGWDAQYIGESDNEVLLETGETTTSWFKAKNIGTNTVWSRSFVDLGTTNPRDRASRFANASWLNVMRPTRLSEATVAPGQIGTFVFTVTAPPVDGQTTFRENFAPVAEGRGWMENVCSPAGWCPNGVWLDYTVRPASPPTVGFASVPPAVPAGSPVVVTVNAADNVRVASVQLALGSSPPLTDTQAPYTFSVPTAGFPPGVYPLTAVAVDGAGHRATATTGITLAPVANGANASRTVRLTAGFGKRLRAHHTVRFGHAAHLRGRLTTTTGAPIAGAVLQLFARPAMRGTDYRALPAVVATAPDGRFLYRVPPGASRRLRVAYTAFSGDAPAAIKTVEVDTRASVSFAASRRVVAPGGVVRFRGRLRGSAPRKRDVIVVLRGWQRGIGWRTFETVRTGRDGRFRGRWRFTRSRHTTLRFHAVLRRQAGYPYATGASRTVRVSVL